MNLNKVLLLLLMMMMMMMDVVCCLLFVIRGQTEGICILPSKWVWEPKKVRDEGFHTVCVFFCVASQKRVYVSERKLV